jgi:hypothetical protein
MRRTIWTISMMLATLFAFAGVASAADDTAQVCPTTGGLVCIGNLVHADNLVSANLVHVDTMHVFG